MDADYLERANSAAAAADKVERAFRRRCKTLGTDPKNVEKSLAEIDEVAARGPILQTHWPETEADKLKRVRCEAERTNHGHPASGIPAAYNAIRAWR